MSTMTRDPAPRNPMNEPPPAMLYTMYGLSYHGVGEGGGYGGFGGLGGCGGCGGGGCGGLGGGGLGDRTSGPTNTPGS